MGEANTPQSKPATMGVLHVVKVFDSLRCNIINLLVSVGWISLLKDGQASDHGRCALGVLKLHHDFFFFFFCKSNLSC